MTILRLKPFAWLGCTLLALVVGLSLAWSQAPDVAVPPATPPIAPPSSTEVSTNPIFPKLGTNNLSDQEYDAQLLKAFEELVRLSRKKAELKRQSDELLKKLAETDKHLTEASNKLGRLGIVLVPSTGITHPPVPGVREAP
jgi:hypothetical protein